MPVPNISKVFRVEPASLVELEVAGTYLLLTEPSALVRLLKPGISVGVAHWDWTMKEAPARRIVISVTSSGAKMQSAPESVLLYAGGRRLARWLSKWAAFNV